MLRVVRNSAFVFGLLAASIAPAAGPHGPVAAPVVVVGDSWTYQYIDVWKNEPGNVNRMEVTSVNENGIDADIKRAATGVVFSHQRFSREMNPIDRGKMHFAPAFGRFSFPLDVGKQWSSETTGENPSQGKHWRYRVDGKALGWEKIKVKAGEFDALKIEVTAFYQGQETGSQGGSGRLSETLWYAPEVKNFVKMEYQDTDWNGRIFNRNIWELTAYVNKQAAAN